MPEDTVAEHTCGIHQDNPLEETPDETIEIDEGTVFGTYKRHDYGVWENVS